MTFDVGQAFLDDAEQRNSGAVDQLAVEFIFVIGHGQAAALLEFRSQLADGGWQAKGIEQG
ncbi:hypothetical protein D3C80_2084980 [compost metagenome]